MSLRDRIATAIREAASEQTYWVPGPILSGIYADAVIKKLDLKQTYGVGEFSGQFFIRSGWHKAND